MNNLTEGERAYFSNDINWTGGMGYEVYLLYPTEYLSVDLQEVLLKFCGLIPWQAWPDNPKMRRSVLLVPSLPSVGLTITFRDVNVKLSECTLFIGSKQFKRTVGSHTEVKVKRMDRARLAALHDALFSVIHSVSREAPILNATIGFESSSWDLSIETINRICMSTSMACYLKLPYKSIPSNPWLAAVEALV